VAALTIPNGSGVQWAFVSWSQGGAASQAITAATTGGTTYTAAFQTQFLLTTSTNTDTGTITPGGWYNAGSVVSILATPPPGYLVSFSGDLSGTTNPQNLTMDGPKTVGASFMLAGGTPNLTAYVMARADGSIGQRVWTIRLNNAGAAGTATNSQITSLSLTQTSGTLCSPAPSLVSTLPVTVGTIVGGSYRTANVTLDFSGCQDATPRFSVIVGFSANSGAYSGSTVLNNQQK
jgi:hypothetical protein